MSNFAIFNIEKRKTMAAIVGTSGHMDRSMMPANAVPERGHLNRTIIGDPDKAPHELVEARIDQTKKPLRKNGVLALEVMCGMSHEWGVNATPAELDAWVETNVKWLQKEFGAENVVALRLHMDERTPHLTGYVVPVDPTTGKLNASRWMDGKGRLNEWQDKYAEGMTKHGLERGIRQKEGSADHNRLAEFYGAMKTDVGDIVVPPISVPPAVLGRKEWAASEQERLQTAVRKQARPLQDKARAGMIARSTDLDIRMAAVKQREAGVDKLRDLPLTEVLERLGMVKDRADKKQWKDGEQRFRITVEEGKFYDHFGQKGGGGALDLVMHVMGSNFTESVAWLGDRFGRSATQRSVMSNTVQKVEQQVDEICKTTPPFALPSVQADRALIDRYLTGRGIDISNSQEKDSIYKRIVTDSRKNVGFIMLNEHNQPIGLELKGTGQTPFTGLALGSSKDGAFSFASTARIPGKPSLYLTESAVEALSLFKVLKPEGASVFMSTAGVRGALPLAARRWADRVEKIVIAYNRDVPGFQATKNMLDHLKGWFKGKVEVLCPAQNDWNDVLMGRKTANNEPDFATWLERLTNPRRRGRPGRSGEAGPGLF